MGSDFRSMERTICKFKIIGTLAAFLVLLSACNRCDIDCENGGECKGNNCDCPEEFFGEFCELSVTDELIGEFEVIEEDCTISNSEQGYSIVISKGTDSFFVQNFSNFDLKVKAILSADSLIIPMQAFPEYLVEGSIRFIQPGQIQLNSYITSGSKTDSCIYFATK